MSRTVSVSLTTKQPDVKFSYRSFSWDIYWQRMQAIDRSGRTWCVKEDGDKLYLDYAGKVHATMSIDEVKESYQSHKKGRFVKKWVSKHLL